MAKPKTVFTKELMGLPEEDRRKAFEAIVAEQRERLRSLYGPAKRRAERRIQWLKRRALDLGIYPQPPGYVPVRLRPKQTPPPDSCNQVEDNQFWAQIHAVAEFRRKQRLARKQQSRV